MCGIVAIISKKSMGFVFKDTEVFKQMLYTNALRGFDSTGIFGINRFNNLKMHKAAQPAANFLATKTFEDFKSDMYSKYKVVVGHNRAATKGATTDDNAHPFIEDHICLVHNGTLTEHKSLADKDVDSHAICHAFAKDGYLETLPKLNGAYALIWYDALDNKLRIARNDQRPLWVVETEDAHYIASEPTMLIWLLQRNYNKVHTPKFFQTGTIYTYDMDNLEKGYTTEDIPAKKVMPVVVTIPSKFTQAGKKKRDHKQNWKTSTVVSTSDKLPTMGERLFFSYGKSVVQNKTIKIEGKWLKDKSVSVSGYIDISKYSADQIEYMLEYATEFSGIYRGYSIKRDKSQHLFLEDVIDCHEYETITGEFVTDAMLAEAGNCCHECGTILDPVTEETEFWARIKHGHIKELKCPTCVAQHEFLSILVEKKCTKESSSSDTSSALNQSAA